MEIKKQKSVAFTEYRTEKLLHSDRNNPNLLQAIFTKLESTILLLYNQGYTRYYSCMAEGFDLMATETVLKIKETHPQIELIAVIPFQGQELGYTPADKKRYDYIYHTATDRVFSSEVWHNVHL